MQGEYYKLNTLMNPQREADSISLFGFRLNTSVSNIEQRWRPEHGSIRSFLLKGKSAWQPGDPPPLTVL
jgi:hypothetical protein